jgi:archaellum component FlaC
MPTIEERVAYIEGQMSEQSHALLELRDAIRHMDQKMDARFDLIERRFGSIDQRFETFDRRFEAIDRRFEAIDRRFEAIERRFETMDRRFESLDDKVSRQFVWLVGGQLTTLVAIVGALLARS